MCIDLEVGAVLTGVHAFILTSCDNSVPVGQIVECTAYLRLLCESLEDSDFTVYNMMSYNTPLERNWYCSRHCSSQLGYKNVGGSNDHVDNTTRPLRSGLLLCLHVIHSTRRNTFQRNYRSNLWYEKKLSSRA